MGRNDPVAPASGVGVPNSTPARPLPSGGAVLHRIGDDMLELAAAEPRRQLFPILRHARAMTPLMVLVASLPALYAFAHGSLSDAGALWGLKALQCAATSDVTEFVDPGFAVPSIPFRWQPPLVTWLTAACMRLFGTAHEFSLTFAAYLATVGLVLMGYLMGRRLGDERLGLLTGILLGFNLQILKLAQDPAPQALSLALLLLFYWSMLGHWRLATSAVSFHLLIAGASFGLALLACGPLAIVAWLVLVLVACVQTAADKLQLWRSGPQPGSGRKTSRMFSTIGIVALTGMAIGGWWELMMASSYGNLFWSSWLTWTSAEVAVRPAQLADARWLDLLRVADEMLFPLAPLAVLGLASLFRRRDVGTKTREDGRFLLLTWILAAGALFAGAGPLVHSNGLNELLWQNFILVPLLMSAAIGVLEIIDRRLSYRDSLLIILVVLVDIGWQLFQMYRHPEALSVLSGSARLATLVSIALAGSLVLWGIGWRATVDLRRRSVLAVLLLLAVCINCAWGLSTLKNEQVTPDAQAVELRGALQRLNQVQRYTFLPTGPSGTRSAEAPAKLRYLFKSYWPAARASTADSWNSAVIKTTTAEAQAPAPAFRNVIVVWNEGSRFRLPAANDAWKPLGPALKFHNTEITLYAPAENRSAP